MQIGVDRLVARELHAAALGAPAYRARDVQRRGRGRAARQHEARERRELGLERVDPALELVDVGWLGSGIPLFARCAASGVASEPPSANSSDWIRASSSRRSRSAVAAAATPSAALSSSTAPYASTRSASFATRSPPNRSVCPPSPRRV